MDFIEYAKWGIRVKEEPGTLGTLHLDKPDVCSMGKVQGGWMCKFPCDAPGALDSAAVTDNLPYELMDPFESSPINYLEEDQEYFNLQDSVKFTGSTFTEGNNNNTDPKDRPTHIVLQDEFANCHAEFRKTLEENNTVTSLSNGKEMLKDVQKQMLDAVFNVQRDISEDLVPVAGDTKQREFVQGPKKSALKRPNEETFIVKNHNEIPRSSDLELLFGTPENAGLVKKCGTMDLNVKNNLSREFESRNEECVMRAQQTNSQKENNDFRISEISSFECPDCGEFLNSFNGFITHMNSHIIQERGIVDTVECENCEEKFDDEGSLFLHQKECNREKANSLFPSQNKHYNNHSSSNSSKNKNAVCLTVNCSEKNVCASKEQCALEENSELVVPSHCQETTLKNFPEQQASQCQSVSSFSPKRRRLGSTEECLSSEVTERKNSWTVQNLGAADDAFDVSWSSEIKCGEEKEGKNVGSVRTLSLRLFRFRRPRVVVKRAKVPDRNESVIKTVSSKLGDSVSNNIINQKSVCQKENVKHLKHMTKESVTNGDKDFVSNNIRNQKTVCQKENVEHLKQMTKESVINGVKDSVSNNIKKLKSDCQKENVEHLKQMTKESASNGVKEIPESDSKTISSNIIKPHRKPKRVLHSEKGGDFVSESTDSEKCHLQSNLTAVHSESHNLGSLVSDMPFSSSVKISEEDKSNEPVIIANNKFPTEETKVRSNLKIKIKPVVVLDRLSSFNLSHNTNKSSKDNTSKCVGSESSEKNLPKEININAGSCASEKCAVSNVETKSKKIANTFVEQPARHSNPYSNVIKQSENGFSFADLEKRYCLKKCYVKLKRISEKPCALRKIVKRHNINNNSTSCSNNSSKDETECEIKICGKLKLRRMGSKLWTVSSCSYALENKEDAEYPEDKMKTADQFCVTKNTEQYPSEKVHRNEIGGQRLKKCIESKASFNFSDSPEEALNKYMLRGKQEKHFRSDCTCCQKTFFNEQDLEQHLETHLSGYKCPNCSVRFHFEMELQAHVAGCSLANLLDCHKQQALIKPCQVVL